MTMHDTSRDPFDLCRRMDVRVFEVDGLPKTVVYCPDSDLAFVRAGLDQETRHRTADWLLCEALAERSSL